MLAVVNTPKGQAPVELRDLAEPQLAPNEAMVAVQAFSLNRGELTLLATRPEGWRPGQDMAGTVVKRAADGSGPAEGTRVAALLEGEGWAQRAPVPTGRLAVLPESASLASAATLPIAGLTAFRALSSGGFLPGRRVLITGASGAVGRFAVQIAEAAGAEVTGMLRNPERASRVRELGAVAVVTSLEEAEGLYDLILDTVGGPTLAQAIGKIAQEGCIVPIGNTAGETTSLNVFSFVGDEGARLQPFLSYYWHTQAEIGQELTRLVWLVSRGKVIPPVDEEHTWRELAQVVTSLRARGTSSKVVFHVD